MLLNCDTGKDSWEPLGQQRDQTSQSQRKSTLNIHWKDNAEAEAPTLWPADAKHQLIGKDPDAEKDWGQEEKGATEDEMVRWHHWLNGHEFEQTLGDNKGHKLGVLQFMGSQRIGHALVTEQQHRILNQKPYFATAKIIMCFFSLLM